MAEHVRQVRRAAQAVNLKKPGVNRKAKALWSMRDAKANGEAHHDQSCERQNESRASVRQALWEPHVKSPTDALEEALRRTEDGSGVAQSSASGGSDARERPVCDFWASQGAFI